MNPVTLCIFGMLIGAIGVWLLPPDHTKMTWADFFTAIFLASLFSLVFMVWEGKVMSWA